MTVESVVIEAETGFPAAVVRSVQGSVVSIETSEKISGLLRVAVKA